MRKDGTYVLNWCAGLGVRVTDMTVPETMRIEQEPQRAARVRLVLSGGGNRAMIGGAGALAYLTQHGWWDRVDEVVSVSGGSTANAAVLTRGAHSYEQTLESIEDFFARATHDLGQPWRQPKRFGFLAMLIAPVLVLLLLILASIGLVPIPDILHRPVVGLVIGLVAPFATSVVVRRAAAGYLRNYLGSLTNGFDFTLSGFRQSPRQHVICASGLSSGHPYYLWSGGTEFFAGGDLGRPRQAHIPEQLWGISAQAEYSVADAVFASSSLPTLARVQAPNITERQGIAKELLIDGGVSGIFGGQVGAGLRDQGSGGARSNPSDGHIIVIDSGRHVQSPGRVGRTINRLSISALLARWLKVSLEAGYRRDLRELDDTHLIRIAEGFGELNDNAGPVLAGFDELRRRTAQMGLLNYNADRALNAFVTGWVGSALTLDQQCSPAVIEAGLGALGSQMGRGEEFVQYWRSVQ